MREIEKSFRMLIMDVERQMSATIAALKSPEEKAIAKVEDRDDYLDNQKSVIENQAYEIIHGARETSQAELHYLRALNVATSNLERLGDHAVNVSRQLRHLADKSFLDHYDYASMFTEVKKALTKVYDAFVGRDMGKALKVCRSELTLDRLYKQQFDRILLELRSGEKTGDLITALFIFRYLERMGDALLNIGEAAIFAITGNKFKIKQYDALSDALEARGEANPLSELEFRSIWGSRSGCRIGRVHKRENDGGDGDVIFKDGSREKLKTEAENIARWEKLAPGLPPRVEALREHKKTTSMLIEALPGDTVQDVILTARTKDIRKSLTTMALTVRGLWEKSMKPEPVRAAFMDQLDKRLPEILKVHPGFDLRAGHIGGAHVFSLKELVEAGREAEENLEAPFSIFIHGDFNSNNIIYNAKQDRIHYIDLHRSADSDICQDASVFLISNFRLPVFDAVRRRCINAVGRAFFDFVGGFAAEHEDSTFEARLALGLARSFITSTRFELGERFARLMFTRGLYLLEKLALHKGDFADFRLPMGAILY